MKYDVDNDYYDGEVEVGKDKQRRVGGGEVRGKE